MLLFVFDLEIFLTVCFCPFKILHIKKIQIQPSTYLINKFFNNIKYSKKSKIICIEQMYFLNPQKIKKIFKT